MERKRKKEEGPVPRARPRQECYMTATKAGASASHCHQLIVGFLMLLCSLATTRASPVNFI